MSEINTARWTSDHLMKPGGTALYAAQQRERLRQMADEVQALLGEYRADLESMKIEGDKPFESKIRAFLAARPLARLEKDLRSAVNNSGKLDKQFQRRYVELPIKRKQAAEQKALEKARKSGIADSRAMNTAGQVQGLAHNLEDPATAQAPAKGQGQDQTFVDFLKRA